MPRVTNRTNTGVSHSVTQTTGSTGSVTNRVNVQTVQGADGGSAPGRVVIDRTPDINVMTAGHVAAARASALSSAEGAMERFEGHMAQARQQALGAVPAEYRDVVNQRFDTAAAQFETHRQRIRTRLG